jgi:hypothetical protein
VLELSRGSDHLLPNLVDWREALSPVQVETIS